jgi:predicted HTH domain antitoxin
MKTIQFIKRLVSEICIQLQSLKAELTSVVAERDSVVNSKNILESEIQVFKSLYSNLPLLEASILEKDSAIASLVTFFPHNFKILFIPQLF